MESILTGLNPEQKKAVTHRNGPLLIIAGAGTGKTTVITRRIAYLIQNKIAKPSEILALTFTEKAAAEMEERVDIILPYGIIETEIATFHAFGDRLLREYSLDLGLPANFKILTETEQLIFFRENLFAFDLKKLRPLSNPLSHISAILKHISRLKDELITTDEYLNFAHKKLRGTKEEAAVDEGELTVELANTYKRYQDLLIQSGSLDFGDQLFMAYNLLKNNSRVRNELVNRYKYILVDEFQDTNFAQNEIIKLLAGKSGNITVVGDDDQSIYRFRGASISNILDFKKSFSGVTEVVLTENYRSTQKILDNAYRLIQFNNPDRLEVKNQINKRLTGKKGGDSAKLIFADSLSSECDIVADEIMKLHRRGIAYNQIAILVRANNQGGQFIQSLKIKRIPAIFTGNFNFFEIREVMTIISFMKVLAYNNDNLSLYTLANSEIYQISDHELVEYFTSAKESNRPLEKIFRSVTDNKKIARLITDIDTFRQKKSQSVGTLLYDYLSETKYLKRLTKSKTIDDELKIINISKFFKIIDNFINASQKSDLLSFLENLELIIEAGGNREQNEIDPEINAINILTVHSAKGLEWPVVFVVNLVADRFPSKNVSEKLPIPEELIKERLPEGEYHLQEERRLFYVATTRAKEKLYLTAGRDYGGKRIKKISPFVLEFLGENIIHLTRQKPQAIEKIERFRESLPLLTKNSIAPIKRLSRQQIDDYFSCPKKYYYINILRFPLLDNQNLMYGTAIHAALNYFFKEKLRSGKPEKNKLINAFKQAFRSVGFINLEHEKLRFEQGIVTLTNFFDRDQKQPIEPQKVEESFEFMVNNVRIIGRYDLVCTNPKESIILDFKTSSIENQKDADRRMKSSTQMRIYALAWNFKNHQIPKTCLYFLEKGIESQIIFDHKELNRTNEMIVDVITGINKQDFKAKPSYNECLWCPFKNHCSNSQAKNII
jgi:DNA helicase-2/ATP-dependent DNA helicase PcrA